MGHNCVCLNKNEEESNFISERLSSKRSVNTFYSFSRSDKFDITLNNHKVMNAKSKSIFNLQMEEKVFELLKKNKDEEKDLFKEINYARNNPKLYSSKIKNHRKNIKKLDDTTLIYRENFSIKHKLLRGELSFHNCIEFLQKSNSLHPFEFDNQLIIEFPKDTSDLTDKEQMINLIHMKKNEKSNKNKSIGFHYDIGSLNAETRCVLQLIDDSCQSYFRRDNLFSSNYKSIGISVQRIPFKKIYIVYLVFS